ncbi:hypothetical protein P175DRAFT_0224998 [Aspergillus ochraceoroseus IBT 24754]|uniref:Uncharacterized protein n=1 Tax=Aspergillus ochraceoroseus IBT 24754 TaxID=1392256 RepID=A0A2T5LWF9_9EURO|nr:uncharacterized protein P175DRAFT_0224998 [Aspergillus ochraceoroseus IBT 24754]PTU20619.1 hypothetical protein P175DRAFT_0224998 [Aspergillus ochraceoroseus IBT 24754]
MTCLGSNSRSPTPAARRAPPRLSSQLWLTTVDCATGPGAIPELEEEDGFWLGAQGDSVHIVGQNSLGALYGALEYLSMLAQGHFSSVAYASSPHAPIRWVNQWDNMGGSIERGYAGPSIFFSG